ncbi:MAG: prephenate dehydrogenase [Candidatus Spyradocola sp.]|jgi:prephenate dehydrogenase
MNRNTRFLIVGLGLIGGCYARRLTALGHSVDALDTDPDAIAYAQAEGIIRRGAAMDEELVREADVVIFGLYPKALIAWLRAHQGALQPGALLTDVSGVKTGVVDVIQSFLRPDVEFVGAHPMAGREVSGVRNSDARIFQDANFLITPTEKNTRAGIEAVHELAEILGFARISLLSPAEHDEMVGFLSQLTHVIAMSLMNCNENPNLAAYTGDSFRDLTRIARINDRMWSELFLLNRETLLRQIDAFTAELAAVRQDLVSGDEDDLRDRMRRSTARRALFDKEKKPN